VTIVSNATGSPAAIALSGTGVAQQTQHSVQLTWTDSDSSIAGYNVYRTTTSGSGYVLVNGSLVGPDAFSDTSVQAGVTYYYVTTAVDSSGNESAYSNEAQAIIP
jgi:fibronectin type 3 domain-containing protein